MTNQEFVKMLLDKVQVIFEKDKHLVPVLIINRAKNAEDPDEFIVTDTVSFMDNGKDALATIIAQLRTQIKQMAFITEAWTVITTPEELAAKDFVQPSDRADKKEIAMVSFYFGPDIEIYMAELTMDKEEKKMGEWELVEGSKAGRFINGNSDVSEFCPVPEEDIKET